MLTLATNGFAKQSQEELFNSAVEYSTNERNTKKANKYFIQSSKAESGHYPSYYNLSLLHLQAEEYKNSIKYVDKAITFNPFDTRMTKMAASAYLMTNDFIQTQKYAKMIIAKNRADINAHKKLGIAYAKKGQLTAAISEFTLVKNLAPSDKDNNLLLSTAYALNGDYKTSLKKIDRIKDSLTRNKALAFYGVLLEKNNQVEEAKSIYKMVSINDKELVAEELIYLIQSALIKEELSTFKLITKFENPEVSKRIVKKLAHEKELRGSSPESIASSKRKRPFGLKGTLTETLEHYDRDPKTSSPINGLNTTTNIKLEGKVKKVNFSAEVETFFNRWDDNKVDFYKVNVVKSRDYEVDVGKFSSKHFPSLVSYPTVLDGIRVWKKLTRSAFKPKPVDDIYDNGFEPVNIGEIYRTHNSDNRLFQDLEITMAFGRTAERKNIGDRKEENEKTLETSGQHEQWTQSYRLHSNITKIFELGASLSMTSDLPERAVVSSSTNPSRSVGLGIDGGLDLFNNKLNLDGEIAFSDHDLDVDDNITKHARDDAYLFTAKFQPFDVMSVSYDFKNIGRNFEIEGASQTQDKITHEFDLIYNPRDPKTWSLKTQTFTIKPEITGANGGGATKKQYRTFQSVSTFLLPQDATYIFDYKYYRERDKCGCSDYLTRTYDHAFNWLMPKFKTTFKPGYSFERKNDITASATDEKKKEYTFTIE
ncbi:MAG: hypothetical protein ACI9E5_001366, partial [Candidatus Omnitrophota bacterium]